MPSKASLALVVCLAYGGAVMSLPVLETRSHHQAGGVAAVVTQTTTTTTTVTAAVAVDDNHHHHHKNGTIAAVDSTQKDTSSDPSADAGTPDDNTLTRRGHGHKKHKHKNHHNKKNHSKTKAAVAVVGAGGAGAVLAADAANSSATDPNAANPAAAGADVQGEPSTPITPESDKSIVTLANGADTAPAQIPVDASTATPPALETRGWFYDLFHPKPKKHRVAEGAKLSNNDANQRTQFTSGVLVSERGYFDDDFDLW